MLAARRADRLEALGAELGSQAQVLVLPTDIADPASLYRLANAAGERFGAIDVWINNAGTTHREGMAWWEEDPSFVQEMVTVNLTAPMVSVGAAMPWLKKSKGAHIINVGSISGHVALKGVYSATKFGLRGHTEALRRELQRPGNPGLPGLPRVDRHRDDPSAELQREACGPRGGGRGDGQAGGGRGPAGGGGPRLLVAPNLADPALSPPGGPHYCQADCQEALPIERRPVRVVRAGLACFK